MKNLFENWKKFLIEGPYDEGGSGTYEVETGAGHRDYNPESVGYKQFKNVPKFNADFKSIMETTPDNWIFIFLKDVHVVRPLKNQFGGVSKQEAANQHKPEFIKWLKTKLNDPKYNNSIVVVVTDSPYNDPKFGVTANWFLHDVVGHTIGHNAKDNKSIDFKIVNSLHKNLLTKETSPATASFDKINDVLAAIVTGHLTKEKAEQFINNSKLPKAKAIATVNELFNITESWMNSLKRWPDGYNQFNFWVAGNGLTTETI